MTTDARPSAPRIISLLPAATEIVAALGAFEQLVGITHECDFPVAVATLPRVTSSAVDRDATSAAIDAEVRELSAAGAPVFALDADKLGMLRPDVVLTQSLCDVCALPQGDVDRAVATLIHAPSVVSLGATTLAGVWDDILRVGAAIGRHAEAESLVASLQSRMLAVHERLKAARAPRPRVAVIEWLDPLFVAGHWTPELVRRAGGVDVLALPGAHSVQISIELVRDAGPDVLLFAPCGFDVERAALETAALLATAEWRWAQGVRSFAMDGNALTSRPGPRLVDAIEAMAALFAPSVFHLAPSPYTRQIGA